MLEDMLNVKMNYIQLPWRESDQKVFVADIEKTVDVLAWKPEITKNIGVGLMIDWMNNE